MLKPREERVKVLARARMRSGTSWSDACIVNLSTRGIGLQCANPPEAGSYVEVRRGSHVMIIGRVVWSKGHRFGVYTQMPVWIDAVLKDAEAVAPKVADRVERRARPRLPGSADWSRLKARLMQFGFVVIGGLCFALSLASMVEAAFARPFAEISTVLRPASPD